MDKIIGKLKRLKSLFLVKKSQWLNFWHNSSFVRRNYLKKVVTKVSQYVMAFLSMMLSKKNFRRDAGVVSCVIFFFLVVAFGDNLFFYVMERRSVDFLKEVEGQEEIILDEKIYEEVRLIQESIDMENWKSHRSQWYGFEIKYPHAWKNPINLGAARGAMWEYQYQFRRNEIRENDPYVGFDLVIYNLAKTGNLFKTDEFPAIKNKELENDEVCQNIEGHIIETGDYPAEEIYVPLEDDCYGPALFFSYTKGNYIYNLVPVLKDGYAIAGDPRIEINDYFPDFFAIVSTLNPIDIVRPKTAVAAVKPKITAPKPVSYKKVNGKMVCAKKSDNPGKSKQNKGKHLDMECCLDPDEYPNPWCYYDPKKYGKYL